MADTAQTQPGEDIPAVSGATASPSADSNGSGIYDQIEIEELTSELRSLDQTQSKLKERLEKWKAIDFSKSTLDDAQVQVHLQKLHEALKQLIGTPPANMSNLNGVLDISNQLTSDVQQPLLFGNVFLMPFNSQVEADQIITECINSNMNLSAVYSMPLFDGKFQDLLNQLSQAKFSGKPMSVDDLKAYDLAEIEKNLPLDSSIQDKFDQMRSKLSTQVQNVIKALGDKIDQNEIARNNLIKSIKTLGANLQGRQNDLSKYLGYCIPLMIAAVCLVIFYLRLLPAPLPVLLIRDRTLVDIFSITFLFIAILFLGAGSFVDRGVLGTLLGTIAGYIFARRSPTGNNTVLDNGTPPSPSLPGTVGGIPTSPPSAPPKPDLNVARGVLTLSRLPAAASFISGFYREVGNKDAIWLGSATGPILTFSPLKLEAGKAYEFWVTASNSTGEGPESEHVIYHA